MPTCRPTLRRLRPTQSSLAKLLELVHAPELAIWDAGYDGDGRWSDELARGARGAAMAAHAAAMVGAAKARQHREVWLEEPSLKMTKGVLQRRCEAAGLPVNGLKADLFARLVGAPPPPPQQQQQQQQQQQPASAPQQARAGAAASRGAPQGAGTSRPPAPAGAAGALARVPAQSTLERWDKPKLIQRCHELGLATEGSKPTLARQLRVALLATAAAPHGACTGEPGPAKQAPTGRAPTKPPAKPPPSKPTKPQQGTKRSHEAAASPQQRERNMHCAVLRQNSAFIREELGLPCPFDVNGRVRDRELNALRGELPWDSGRLELRARLVDYYSGCRLEDQAMARWLQLLGFKVKVDNSANQIGLSCGAVAAQALAIMLGAYGEWWDADCRPAASPELTRYAYGVHDFRAYGHDFRAVHEGLAAARARAAGGVEPTDGVEQETYRLGNAQVCEGLRAPLTRPPH